MAGAVRFLYRLFRDVVSSNTIVIYGKEQLTLRGNLVTELLIVHLSTPPAVVNLNGHHLDYVRIEFVGSGSFETRNGTELVSRVYQS